MRVHYVSAAIAALALVLGCSTDSVGDDDDDVAPGVDAGPEPFLQPPPEGDGFQVMLPEFEVPPGEEIYYCFRVPMPVDQEFDLQRIEQRFSLGAHHMLVMTVDGDYGESMAPCSQESITGDLPQEAVASLRFLGGAQTPYSEDPRAELELEDGMAFQVRNPTTLVFQLHWANTTDATQTATTAINFWYSQVEVTRYLESFFFYHTGIEVPPQSAGQAAGRCTFPMDVEVVGMVSHMHQHGTNYEAHQYDGAQLTDMVYQETRWQDPEMKFWKANDLIEIDEGQGFEYRCFYQNNTDEWIYEGEGANDEMCMLVGLYAGGTGTLFGAPGFDYPGNPCVAVD